MIDCKHCATYGHKPLWFAPSIDGLIATRANPRMPYAPSICAVSKDALTNERISTTTDPKIVLDQTDEETLLWEVSDEYLEVVSGMGAAAAAVITLCHASYCFACPS
jgi:hypothetical protein